MRGRQGLRRRHAAVATPPRWPTGGSPPWPGIGGRAAAGHVPRAAAREAPGTATSCGAGSNWEEYLREERPSSPVTFEAFERALGELYAAYTPEFAERESGRSRPRASRRSRARSGARARRLATHVWRNAAAGNLGGWAGRARARAARACWSGAVGHPGGTAPSAWNKAVPAPPMMPPPGQGLERAAHAARVPARLLRDELPPAALPPREAAASSRCTSRGSTTRCGRIPTACRGSEMLTDEATVERHACLTPIWSETAWFADYVLPMGHASERHDLMSAGDARRALDRLPPAGAARGARAPGQDASTDVAGPRGGRARAGVGGGRVLDRAVVAHRSRRRRSASASTSSRRTGRARSCASRSSTAGSSSTACPASRRRRGSEGLTPLEYMRKYGAFLVEDGRLRAPTRAPLAAAERDGGRGRSRHPRGQQGRRRGGGRDRRPRRVGFPTPSRKLEFFSKTLKDWKWPEHAVPTYVRSHVHWSEIDRARGEMLLLPDLPAADSRSTRAPATPKWLYEISHTQPAVAAPRGRRRGSASRTGDLLKVETEIGHFVDRVWVTEVDPPRRRRLLASPRALAAARSRREASAGPPRWWTFARHRAGQWRMRHLHGVRPFESADPDSAARVVGGRGRAPEPHLPGASRPGERPALLAPEGARCGRPASERYGDVVRRHRPGARGVPALAGDDAVRRPGRAGCGGRSGCRAPSSPTSRRTGSRSREAEPPPRRRSRPSPERGADGRGDVARVPASVDPSARVP